MADTSSNGEPRIGVYVCNCGLNIAGTVDCPSVAEFARWTAAMKLHVVALADSMAEGTHVGRAFAVRECSLFACHTAA